MSLARHVCRNVTCIGRWHGDTEGVLLRKYMRSARPHRIDLGTTPVHVRQLEGTPGCVIAAGVGILLSAGARE